MSRNLVIAMALEGVARKQPDFAVHLLMFASVFRRGVATPEQYISAAAILR